MGLVLLLGLSSIWNPHDWRGGIDYYQFWVVGQATGAEQVGDIYSDEERGRLGAEYYQRALVDGSLLRKGAAQRRQILETYSTPFLYTVFGVLSTGDYDTDITAYNFLSLASVVLAIVAISACLGLPGMAAAAAILLFTAWFAPFLSDFAVTNVNGLQLGLLALFLWTRARARKPVHDVVGGVVLGLAVLFKPNLVFVAALLVASRLMMRRVRLLGLEAVGMLAAGVIALIATSVRFGSIAIWARWVEALRDLPDEIITIQLGNFAPYSGGSCMSICRPSSSSFRWRSPSS
jgi:hypothetical protein